MGLQQDHPVTATGKPNLIEERIGATGTWLVHISLSGAISQEDF